MFIERDPNINKLQNEVFSKLNDIFDKINPTPSKSEPVNNVSFISVEDAAAELLKMYKDETDKKES